jgi:hypothetical protein
MQDAHEGDVPVKLFGETGCVARGAPAVSRGGSAGTFSVARRGKERAMGIGASIVLIAVGAILRFAVTIHSKIGSTQVNWNIVGDVLMAVGAIGLVMALIWMMTASRRTTVTDTGYVDRADRP